MKRINYIVLIVLAASLGLVACSESYPSVNYKYESVPTNSETPGEDRSVPLMVFVDRQSFFSLSSTRGAGHFDPISTTSTEDEKDKALKTPFYLYAFRDPRFTSTSYDNPRLHQLPDLTYTMLATNGGKKDNEKLDCLVDGYNYHEGFKTNLDEKGAMILEDDLFYYPDYQDVGFNFFAYSIDDAVSADDMKSEPQATRTLESIYYDLAIDGTQDIMCGYAPAITEKDFYVDKDKGRYGNIKLTETEKKRILDIGNYCTYAAHRNIHPYIAIRHQLTRLDFVAYPGDSTADYVTIDKIEVKAPRKGRLVVADNDTTQIGYTPDPASEGWFELRESPHKNEDGKWVCDVMPAGKYRTHLWHKEYNPDPVEHPELAVPITERIQPDEKKVYIGGDSACIMLPESEEFLVKIVGTYDPDSLDKTKKRKFESVYRLKPQENDNNKGEDGILRFRPGRYYTIAVAVYGLKEIELFTEIDAWKSAGEITIDPDNPEEADIY